MVSNQFGCGSEVVSFTSISRELLLEPEIASQILCLDDQTELSAIVNSPESPNNWTWSPLDQIDEFIDESVVLVSPDLNTTYTLTASNDFGCETQITFDVEVIDLQNTVDATITTSDLITGQPVTLFVSQNEDYTYSWSPAGQLDDPTSASPTFTLTEEVTFEVEVTDSNGCIAVRTVVVTPADTPCAEPFVFVPNAFSPNGDGLNEQLHVDGNQIVEMHLMVYNRWGERVFEAIDQSQSWDGTYNGKALDPDVFGYTFTCTCTNGDTFSSQGNISLLR
jgi:gliding motility-associated-like protein